MTSEYAIFLHIPKTGGTTLRTLIDRNYGAAHVKFLHIPENLKSFVELESAQKAGIAALSGHIKYGLHALLPGRSRYISMMRDPIATFVSDYYFILRHPTHRLYHMVSSPRFTIRDFAHYRIFEQKLTNPQTRILSGVDVVDTAELDHTHLERAKFNIMNHFAVVGITERFNESVMLMKHELQWRHILYKVKNQDTYAHMREPLSDEVRSILRNATQIDTELYRFTNELLSQRIAAAGSRFEKQLRRFEFTLHLYQSLFDKIDRLLDIRNRSPKRD